MIQPHRERHVRGVPGHFGHRILGELHVSESVDVLLLCPLLDGTDLVLQALGEVCVRGVRPGEGHLIVHVEHRLLRRGRGRAGSWTGSWAERRLRFRQPGSRPVVGPRAGCLPQRFGDALDRPRHPGAVGSNSAQAPTAMTEIRSSATTVEASALRCLEPALKVRVGMLIVPSGGPESSGVSLPNPRLKALTPAAPADLAAPVARASPRLRWRPREGRSRRR